MTPIVSVAPSLPSTSAQEIRGNYAESFGHDVIGHPSLPARSSSYRDDPAVSSPEATFERVLRRPQGACARIRRRSQPAGHFRHIRADGQCSRARDASRRVYRVQPAPLRPRLAGTSGVARPARRSGRRHVRARPAPRRRPRRGRRHAPAAAARRRRSCTTARSPRRRRRSHRLNLRAPASVSYLRTLASAQRTLQARIEQAIPAAQARWHYGVVAERDGRRRAALAARAR